MAFEEKLSDEQKDAICSRYLAGEQIAKLAADFGVCGKTIKRVLVVRNAIRPVAAIPKASGRDLDEFASRAKSILWRQDTGKDEDRKTYHAWKDRVAALESPDGGGLTRNQAIVRASKEYPCLTRLFREYDVSEFDTNPESHPTIQHFGQPAGGKIVSEARELSYRENLRWAIEAAGTHLRTGVSPTTCPNDSAWYLYRQAIEEPKDFLAKVGQVESKGDADSEEKRSTRKASQRSINEIEMMLLELEREDDGAQED